jgi:hypothetical protein
VTWPKYQLVAIAIFVGKFAISALFSAYWLHLKMHGLDDMFK